MCSIAFFRVSGCIAIRWNKKFRFRKKSVTFIQQHAVKLFLCCNKSDQYTSTTVTLFRQKGGDCLVSYLDKFYIKNLDGLLQL